MEEIKERIKTVLGIKDTLQDDVLGIIIENVERQLLRKLTRVNESIEEIPDELNYITEEIVVRRFNRLGSEGMKSESVEGHRIDFYDLNKEFDYYYEVIEDYREDSKMGKVRFL